MILIERPGGDRLMVDESTLERRVIFEERPKEFVIAVEYREADVLVHRDCHVVLKQAAVTADSTVGGFS